MNPDEVNADALSEQTRTGLTIVMLLGLLTGLVGLLLGRFDVAAVGLAVMALVAWTMGQLARRRSESDLD